MKRIFKISLIFLVLLLCGCTNKSSEIEEVKIQSDKEEIAEEITMVKGAIEVNGNLLTVNFYNNETVSELIQMLPLTIQMNDLNSNEKYYYFDKGFTTNSERIQQIHSGDILLFGDNCLVIFYEDFTTTYSYTKIGYIEDGENLNEIVGDGDIEVILTVN